MKKQLAMSWSPSRDCKLVEQVSDSELEELLLFKDEIDRGEVNDPSLKLSKCETAEKILHDIEDLKKNENDYWLEEFPLFEEIQSLTSFEKITGQVEQSPKDFAVKLNEAPPDENPIAAELNTYLPELFPPSYENSTTFVVSNENILYLDSQSLFHVAPLQPECWNHREESGESEDGKSSEPDPPDSCLSFPDEDMAAVEEILKTTASELDRWESDASSSSLESSPKRTEEETSDPDWSPEPGSKKHYGRRARPYWKEGTQEDKKLRKKEQNKNAATRYRQKKKAEVSEILKKEEQLRDKKKKLEDKVSDIQNEIKYLKGLMRDLFRAKGLIN